MSTTTAEITKASVKRVHVTNKDAMEELKKKIQRGDENCERLRAERQDVTILRKKSLLIINVQTNRQKLIDLKEQIKQIDASILESNIEVAKIESNRRNKQKEIHSWGSERRNISRELNTLEMKEVIATTKKEISACEKEAKKRASKCKTLLSEISKLPEEIVDYIRGFIPYEVRNQMIEDTYNPMRRLIPKMDKWLLYAFIKDFYRDPKYFAYLSPEEAQRHTYGSPTYSPACVNGNITALRVRIMRPIVEMKHKDPAVAYKFLSTIAILIKPDKVYKCNYSLRNLI